MAISQAELMTALQTLLSTVKFRLRGRRGTTAQLDPTLMKAGEFAFITDTRTLYACYVDGVIEQVSHGFIPKATYGTLAALQAAHPTGVASDYYMVGTGPYSLYNWGGAAWVDMGVWNDMSLYATNASSVHLAGSETITGHKSVPTPTADAHIANKGYVDLSNYMSESEHIVGKWHDGRILYEKTVNCGDLPNATTKTTAHGVTGIGNIKFVHKGFAESAALSVNLPHVDTGAANYGISIYIDNTNIGIITGVDKRNQNAWVTIRYVKA